MRKFIKLVVIALGIALAGLALLTIALRVLFPPAKLRHLVSDQVRAQLNREAEVGDIRLGMRGLVVERFKLSEVPGFSSGAFLVVDKVDVRWALRPLLSKKIAITTLTLEKPQVTIVRMPSGKTLNISDLAGASAAAAQSSTRQQHPSPYPLPSPPLRPGGSAKDSVAERERARPTAGRAAGEGWSWSVNTIHLRSGVIRFDDRSPARQTSALSDIDLVLTDFDPTRVNGRLTIGKLENPSYSAQDAAVEWSLQGIDPTLSRLNGWMRLKQGPGLVQNLNQLANASPTARVSLMPLVILQNLQQSGLVQLGLPDFSRLQITDITGDYVFQNGVMKINRFDITGPQATIKSAGTVTLANGELAVDVNLHTPEPTLGGEMDLKLKIGGTLTNPKTNLDSVKKNAFKAVIKGLENPDSDIHKALKKIFK